MPANAPFEVDCGSMNPAPTTVGVVPEVTPIAEPGSWSNVISPKRMSDDDDGMAPSWNWYVENCLLGNWLQATDGRIGDRRQLVVRTEDDPVRREIGRERAGAGSSVPRSGRRGADARPGFAPGRAPGETTHAVAGVVDVSTRTGRWYVR